MLKTLPKAKTSQKTGSLQLGSEDAGIGEWARTVLHHQL